MAEILGCLVYKIYCIRERQMAFTLKLKAEYLVTEITCQWSSHYLDSDSMGTWAWTGYLLTRSVIF